MAHLCRWWRCDAWRVLTSSSSASCWCIKVNEEVVLFMCSARFRRSRCGLSDAKSEWDDDKSSESDLIGVSGIGVSCRVLVIVRVGAGAMAMAHGDAVS